MDIHFGADSSDKAGEIPHIRQSKQDASMTDNSCSLLTFVPGRLACLASPVHSVGFLGRIEDFFSRDSCSIWR